MLRTIARGVMNVLVSAGYFTGWKNERFFWYEVNKRLTDVVSITLEGKIVVNVNAADVSTARAVSSIASRYRWRQI